MRDQPKILIVEDDPLVLKGFETMLKKDGYKIATSENGQDAIELINKENFDIVLTDLKMEGVSGIDLLKEVKKIAPETLVILITGYESIDSAVSALRGGAYDYLLKPCQETDLKKTIQRGLEKRRLETELIKLATTDSLTKLYNRNYFLSRFEEEYTKARRYHTQISCIIIDLDHFKSVNDNYGHQVGDRLLIEVSNLLRVNSRNIDIVGRYGGEEFIIILPQTNSEAAYQFAERLRKLICTKKFKIKDHEIDITISIGISCFPLHKAKSFNDLIKLADDALYIAKEKGRNKTITYNEQ